MCDSSGSKASDFLKEGSSLAENSAWLYRIHSKIHTRPDRGLPQCRCYITLILIKIILCRWLLHTGQLNKIEKYPPWVQLESPT